MRKVGTFTCIQAFGHTRIADDVVPANKLEISEMLLLKLHMYSIWVSVNLFYKLCFPALQGGVYEQAREHQAHCNPLLG